MRWPAGTRLLALDSSPGMTRNVGRTSSARRLLLLADWAAIPVRDAACDLAVGDGFLTSLPYPDGFRAVAAELRRVLKERRDVRDARIRETGREGNPGKRSSPISARTGAPDFGPFTWRLAMALHVDLDRGAASATSGTPGTIMFPTLPS